MNVNESPVLNNGYAVPRDFHERPLRRPPKEGSTKLLCPVDQRDIATAYDDIGRFLRSNGMASLADRCDVNSEFHLTLAECLEEKMERRPNPEKYRKRKEPGDI